MHVEFPCASEPQFPQLYLARSPRKLMGQWIQKCSLNIKGVTNMATVTMFFKRRKKEKTAECDNTSVPFRLPTQKAQELGHSIKWKWGRETDYTGCRSAPPRDRNVTVTPPQSSGSMEEPVAGALPQVKPPHSALLSAMWCFPDSQPGCSSFNLLFSLPWQVHGPQLNSLSPMYVFQVFYDGRENILPYSGFPSRTLR